MEENSLANSEQTPDLMTTQEEGSSNSPKEHTTETNMDIDIEEEDILLPPSFHHTITEEQLLPLCLLGQHLGSHSGEASGPGHHDIQAPQVILEQHAQN